MTALTRPVPSPPERQPMLVALLRIAALECRAAARIDLDACAVLDPGADAADLAALLARALPRAMKVRPVIHAPGTRQRSFDEDWLLAVQGAVATGDAASERFLLRRRCTPRGAAILPLLLRALAARGSAMALADT